MLLLFASFVSSHFSKFNKHFAEEQNNWSHTCRLPDLFYMCVQYRVTEHMFRPSASNHVCCCGQDQGRSSRHPQPQTTSYTGPLTTGRKGQTEESVTPVVPSEIRDGSCCCTPLVPWCWKVCPICEAEGHSRHCRKAIRGIRSLSFHQPHLGPTKDCQATFALGRIERCDG